MYSTLNSHGLALAYFACLQYICNIVVSILLCRIRYQRQRRENKAASLFRFLRSNLCNLFLRDFHFHVGLSYIQILTISLRRL